MEYLKQEQVYVDRYDLGTIKSCLKYYQALHKELPKVLENSKKDKELTEEKAKTDWLRMMNIVVYTIKTERFKTKKETINDWMNSDREKQEKLDNAEPGEFYCKDCGILLENTFKELYDRNEQDLKVLFMYDCPKCKKREAYFDDGTEYESKPTLCDKCGSEIIIDLNIDDKKDVTTWTYNCTGCDYKETKVDDHKKWKKEREAEETKNKELLEKFRNDFCFTEEEGNRAVSWFEGVKNLVDDMREREKKEKDPVFQKAKSLNKLKVVEVRKLLKEHLEKAGYIDLQFEKPEMGRIVAVPFIVQDEKADREKYDSEKQLKKLINNALEETNWRLMSDGVHYRVGYLSGRLRCYESDEEMTDFLKK